MLYTLKYIGVFEIPDGKGSCVITLTDEREERVLSVVTNHEMAMDLKEHEKKLESTKSHILDILYGQFLAACCTPVYSIRLDADKDKGFKAFMELGDYTEKPVKVDHAILYSLISGVPLKATRNAFQFFSTPYSKMAHSVALPIVGLPEPMLQQALDKAIGDENYELASVIRDEMKRREEDDNMLKIE